MIVRAPSGSRVQWSSRCRLFASLSRLPSWAIDRNNYETHCRYAQRIRLSTRLLPVTDCQRQPMMRTTHASNSLDAAADETKYFRVWPFYGSKLLNSRRLYLVRILSTIVAYNDVPTLQR